MNGQHIDAKAGCRLHRSGDSIGNVMEFQIEKYAASTRNDLTHDLGPSGSEKLRADLEQSHRLA